MSTNPPEQNVLQQTREILPVVDKNLSGAGMGFRRRQK